jgi:hypothetical protein
MDPRLDHASAAEALIRVKRQSHVPVTSWLCDANRKRIPMRRSPRKASVVWAALGVITVFGVLHGASRSRSTRRTGPGRRFDGFNWRISDREDWNRFARRREKYLAEVVRSKVLQRGHKAVLIAGITHLRHGESETMSLLDRWAPGRVFVVTQHVGFPNSEWQRALFQWPIPSIASLEGTWIGAQPRGD